MQRSPALLAAATVGGAGFLLLYGLSAFRRAAKPRVLTPDGDAGGSLLQAVGICLALTFLNPHVYLDTVILVGSLSSRYSGTARLAYAAGAALASFAWFFALGYGARFLAPMFAKPLAWRILDAGIGVVMCAMAAGLLLAFRP